MFGNWPLHFDIRRLITKAWFGKKKIDKMKKINTSESSGNFTLKESKEMTWLLKADVGVKEEQHKIVYATKQEKFNVK